MQTKICENTEDRFTIHLLVKFKSEMLLTKKKFNRKAASVKILSIQKTFSTFKTEEILVVE